MHARLYSYSAVTSDIRVVVHPLYLDAQSDVLARKFVFAYFITIENLGHDTVQLLRRRWHIAHANGKTEEVDGEGVVGKQPVIPPGRSHEYNSFCILETMEGSMEGSYFMRRKDGATFEVTIPKFTLRAAAN
ncbi:MAG: Co2+/Mg2+ efflux protein ApaG [Ignavibacteria bacterium GWA2_55_11]|nr:MAG: Co2+/Mg2+ efflux protein ApaG [Ignavibacteria bacterium GWA2_55_11]OGU70430.1 MAG: Co2+/Mg2+ efflux protein ApaG [Ignavibacteria bacterium RIFCSPLOWO2_12_FULL_56_21]